MKRNDKPRHIVLGVTGSIAAYKAAELVRRFKTRGWDVSVVMTQAAARFVGELTFRVLSRNPVLTDMFDAPESWRPAHLSYAERASLLLIAPCTANVMAKLAHGIADDALTATALACDAPIVIAPAMNEKMWDHPATRANVETLKKRGVTLISVAEGDLACGSSGRGRMAAVDDIVAAVEKRLCRKSR